MVYYGPSFGNIESGWYRHTEKDYYASGRTLIDQVWSEECGEILKKFVFKYGTYFTAFSEDIIREVDKLYGTDLLDNASLYEYYIANRAYEIEETREHWYRSHRREANKSFNCRVCNAKTNLLSCHPNVVREQGIPPKYCRACGYIMTGYESCDDDIKRRISDFMRHLGRERKCDICRRKFSLEKKMFIHRFARKMDMFPSSGWNSTGYVYPNLFAQVCPQCFMKAFKDCKEGSTEMQLARLYELYTFIGKVPTQDFAILLRMFKDGESIIELLKILQKLRTPEGYRKEFGSFFTALVRSGILPEGSHELPIGTMVLAEDGHMCLSLAEKEIDDFLYRRGIMHDKEVYYPGSRMRTDWELFGGQRRVFVEYFGLMQNPDYANRARQKIRLAEQCGIELIEIYPDDNWKEYLEQWQRRIQ
jgi:hypothetical protein